MPPPPRTTDRNVVVLQKYKLGDPTDAEFNLGPVCSLASAERIRKQVADAGRSPSDNIYIRILSHSTPFQSPLVQRLSFPKIYSRPRNCKQIASSIHTY